MGNAGAHMFLAFGFGDDFLAVSVEPRPDKARPYAVLPGFFKQYELVSVVGDERDVIRVRTNYRKDPPEQVYLFRLLATDEERRRLFVEYLKDINALREHPRLYNPLAGQCILMALDRGACSWKLPVSGNVPKFAYYAGRLATCLPLAELQRRGHINAAAQAADREPDFSRRIRADVP